VGEVQLEGVRLAFETLSWAIADRESLAYFEVGSASASRNSSLSQGLTTPGPSGIFLAPTCSALPCTALYTLGSAVVLEPFAGGKRFTPPGKLSYPRPAHRSHPVQQLFHPLHLFIRRCLGEWRPRSQAGRTRSEACLRARAALVVRLGMARSAWGRVSQGKGESLFDTAAPPDQCWGL
jgi:hypothetical protein